MPELPELEVVREVLERRLRGRSIESAALSPRGGPLVARDLIGHGFEVALRGARVDGIARRGKFLLFDLQPADAAPLFLVVNPKLAGRFQLCAPDERRAGPVHAVLRFTAPVEELRYVDARTMGQLYLTRDLHAVPTFDEMGPDPLEVTAEAFAARLRAFRGEIKGVLTRAAFVSGIGNAYADEILWRARLHPYRKRTRLTAEEIQRLHRAMQETLRESTHKVRAEMGDAVHRKPRSFFAVHLRGREPCPRCGTPISAITANQRITNFCRACQPGGLIRGMDPARP